MKKLAAWCPILLAFACSVAQGAEPKKYGFLGVGLGPVPPALADQLGLVKGEGVLVADVEKDSPADKAGFVENDVITKVEDQIILAEEQLRKLIGHTKPGMVLNVEVIRKTKRQVLTVTLGATGNPPLTGPALGRMHLVPGAHMGPLVERMFITRGPKGAVGEVMGNIKLRGPDGKMTTITLKGQRDFLKQLEELKKKNLIDPRTLERMKGILGELPPAQKPAAKNGAEAKLNKKVSFDFAEAPFTDVISFLSTLCKVNVVLDPELVKRAPAITLKLDNVAARDALHWICRLAKAEYALADDAVSLGEGAFVKKFQALTPLKAGDEKLRAILERPLSFEFHRTPLKEVVAFLTDLLKANVVVLGGAGKDEVISLRFQDVPAGRAFPYIGLLVGRATTIEKGSICFGEPAGK